MAASGCEWGGRTGWCLGCRPNGPEIRAWRKLAPYRRPTLPRELPRGLEQVKREPEAADPTRASL
ncbi:DUF1289 domain-containing protein [Methylobacterium sp. CB376]|nr:DUF1289 domain-containing protein [Methylobacterium nodulans]WFT79604.1 DUF1289 domain-containing protein [Methylobacterium nodulans]